MDGFHGVRRGVLRVASLGVLGALVFAGASASCVGGPRPKPSPEPSPVADASTDDGKGGSGSGELSPEERQVFYHLPQGHEHLSLPVMRALASKQSLVAAMKGQKGEFQSFLRQPERFGLLSDPDHPEQLPVGMALAPANAHQPYARVGFNCAACHVAEFQFRGQKLRVDGAPGLLDIEAFNREMGEVLYLTLTHDELLVDFLVRLSEQLPLQPRESASRRPTVELDNQRLQYAFPANDLSPDATKGTLEKLRAEVKKYRANPEPAVTVDEYVRDLSWKPIRTVSDAIRILQGHLAYFQRISPLISDHTPGGPGRLDAFGAARAMLFSAGPDNQGDSCRTTEKVPLTAPVSFPCLWEFRGHGWMHWDANTNSILQRNIGQSLGMGATIDRKTYDSSVLPRNLMKLEELSTRLNAPRWPELFGTPDRTRVARGEALFARECKACHGGNSGLVMAAQAVGTDKNRAVNFAAKVGDCDFSAALGDLLRRIEVQVTARDGLTQQAEALEPKSILWQSTEGYVSRPLNGIWATPPFLHNGSVPTLWDLLQPPSKRPARFILQGAEFDPVKVGYVYVTPEEPSRVGPAAPAAGGGAFVFDVSQSGNSNEGHLYGTTLSDEEKRDLLEYLKSI
jgi:mono/diheme cytochrome c family protein